ncbi:MAG TPA: (5-formylfuran-3-yl)methyl phosphate synthase [Gemmatimonadales bacterium]|nr:(5-formylfuran-3-yl)methyl phosphate synthase [Gemmatimonadales bacterium]
MRLLVSVRDVDEARLAVAAGADIVDVKEPTDGTLAPASPAVLAAIAAAVPADVPLGVALGEPADLASLSALLAARAATLGGRPVYVKFVPSGNGARGCVSLVRELLPDAMVVVAGYADACGTPAARRDFLRDACAAGADGALLDTRSKSLGLLQVVPEAELGALIEESRARGAFLALAGSLDGPALARLALLGADVAGVRGAACEGGRAGALSAARVAALLRAARQAPRATAAPA